MNILCYLPITLLAFGKFVSAHKKDRLNSRSIFISGAADRNRTGTTVARREILSLLRLPISPQRHGSNINNYSETRFIVKKNVGYGLS
jgi:hypothetical protein